MGNTLVLVCICTLSDHELHRCEGGNHLGLNLPLYSELNEILTFVIYFLKNKWINAETFKSLSVRE